VTLRFIRDLNNLPSHFATRPPDTSWGENDAHRYRDNQHH
jgi:hypothetical protein